MTHPHHICHLSVDENGWIVPTKSSLSAFTATSSSSTEEKTSSSEKIAITEKCRQLLTELQLDLSHDFFSDQACPTKQQEEDTSAFLEDLPKSDKLADLLRGVIGEVRRMGGPSSRDLDRKNNASNNTKNDDDDDKNDNGDGEMIKVKNKKRGGGRHRLKGRVAQLEEQRRLRQEQEAQKEKSNSSVLTEDNDDADDDDNDNVDDDDSDDENEDIDNPEGGENNTATNNNELNSDIRLANTFNTLRVLITILRPILDHPHQKVDDAPLKMKKYGSKNKKKKEEEYYIISTHVYARVTKGVWNDTRLGFFRMLNEVEPGLNRLVMMKKDSNDDGGIKDEYEFNVKQWIANLFNHDQFISKEYVARQCIGEDLLGNNNSDVIHKFHNVLLDRFQNDGDEKKQRKLQESIHNLQVKLSKAISRSFPDVRLTVYGSCLSGLALEGSHDVDVSVYIPQLDHLKQDFDAGVISAAEYEQKMKRIVFRIKGTLQRSESFVDVFAIAHARVPVVKGKDVRAKNPYEEDGSLSFDLCFLNDIAVCNSSLLREYSLFDNRVRILMLCIKSFAKLNNIASAANGTLSSYSWLNLVVFYLQCIGFLPTLQCPKLMEDHNFQPDPNGNRWHSINGLETFYLTEDIVSQGKMWEQSPQCSDVNLPVLLYGFFNFYCNVFPQQTVAASIRLGEMSLQKTSFKDSSKLWRLCVEDPFETYYSHCPHDLGCHLKERGQEQMFDQIDRMTNDLEYLLKQEKVTDDLVNTFVVLFCSDTGSAEPKQQPTPTKNGKSTFKGKCDNCHQVGHKRVDCPLRSKNGQEGGKSNNFKGRCNICQQIGHKKVDCPQQRHNNGHVNKSSGGSHQKNNGGNGGKNTQTAYNNKFVQQQEERLRQISITKQKEGNKSGVEDGEEKTQKHKSSRHRNNRNRQT
jgi:hypothetical protein